MKEKSKSPPGFRRAFGAPEKNGRFIRIQCQKGKESSSIGKRRVFLCRRTVGVKVIATRFLKVEGRGTLVGAKEGQTEELVGGQNAGPEAPPRGSDSS